MCVFDTCLQNFASLGRKISGVLLKATIRNFVRLFTTKNLAKQFFWNELAIKRKVTKLSFKDHEIYKLLQSKLYSGIRLINPRLINPAAYYIQFAWNGIVLILC